MHPDEDPVKPPDPRRLSSQLASDVSRFYLREAGKRLKAAEYALAAQEIDTAKFWAEEAAKFSREGR